MKTAKNIQNYKYIHTRYQNDYRNRQHNGQKNSIYLRKLIFPPISDEKIYQIMIDDESIKYITFASSAQEISNVIMNNLIDFPSPYDENINWDSITISRRMKHLVITEMTAGVGGNVLNFANYFKYVNAIEIDTTRHEYLVNNVKLYEFENVNCYNADSIKLLLENDDISQDIIFFDPPWGGNNYKLFTNLRLNFGNDSVEIVCKKLFDKPRNKMIVMKLPNNYDFGYMTEELSGYKLTRYSIDQMTIVIVKNY